MRQWGMTSFPPLHKLPILLICLITFSTPALAKTSSFPAQIFSPTTDNSPFLGIQASQTLPPLRFSTGLGVDYARTPLKCQGCPSENIVRNLTMVHPLFGIGIIDGFELGISIPVAVDLDFYSPANGANTRDIAMSDIRLEGKYRLLDLEKYPIGLALLPFVTLPTGDSDQFVGSGQLTGGLTLILDGDAGSRLKLALNTGYLMREDVTRFGTQIDDEFIYGVGASLRTLKKLDLIAELSGYVVVQAFAEDNIQSPMEARFGMCYRATPSLSVELGNGIGLIDGVGSPSYRAIALFRFSPEKKSP